MQVNESSRQAILPVPSVPAGESHLPGYIRRVQPLVNLLLVKATATILTEAVFGSGMGAPKFKREWRGFLMHKSHYEHEWARGELYLFGLPGIAVPGSLPNFLPEPGRWRNRASLPRLERREGRSMEPWRSINICWNQKAVQYPGQACIYVYT